MAFKLNKAQIAERDVHVAKLAELKGKLEEALEAYNTEVSKLFDPVEVAIGAYNEALSEAAEWKENIVGDWQGEFDDKSERWQEGDNGQATQELINAWENLDLGEIELNEPEELSLDIDDHSEELDSLPTERG